MEYVIILIIKFKTKIVCVLVMFYTKSSWQKSNEWIFKPLF